MLFPVENASWLEQVFAMLSQYPKKEGGESAYSQFVHIPDTVVFRYQRPAALYCMDEDGILRSTSDSSDLSLTALTARFSNQTLAGAPDRICATYVYINRQVQDADSQDVVVEHLNAEQVNIFLYSRVKEHDGILQQFLASKGMHYMSIRVAWNVRSCRIESRANVYRADDTRVPMKEKACMFDDTPHLSISLRCSAMIRSKVNNAVSSIVQHLESMLPDRFRIWDMILYFKTLSSGVQ